MSWGSDGETKRETRTVTKDELMVKLAGHDWDGLRDFIGCIQDGDELTYESEQNNNRGFSRYIGRRKSGFSYCIVISVMMT